MDLLLWFIGAALAYTALFLLYRTLTTRQQRSQNRNEPSVPSKDINSENGFDFTYDEFSSADLEAAKQKLIASFRNIQQMQNSKAELQKISRYQSVEAADEPLDDVADSKAIINKIAKEAREETLTTDVQQNEMENQQETEQLEQAPDPLEEHIEFYKTLNLKIKEQ